MAARPEWVEFLVTLPTRELRRRQTICYKQMKASHDLAQHADTRDRGERAAVELNDMADSLTEAVMQREFPNVNVQ